MLKTVQLRGVIEYILIPYVDLNSKNLVKYEQCLRAGAEAKLGTIPLNYRFVAMPFDDTKFKYALEVEYDH